MKYKRNNRKIIALLLIGVMLLNSSVISQAESGGISDADAVTTDGASGGVVRAFDGYVDKFTPLRIIEVDKDKKGTVKDIGLPETLKVTLQAAEVEPAGTETTGETGEVKTEETGTDPTETRLTGAEITGTEPEETEKTGETGAVKTEATGTEPSEMPGTEPVGAATTEGTDKTSGTEQTETAPTETETTAGSETTAGTNTAEGTEATEVQVEIPVTWKTTDDSDYETTDFETYDFTPVLPEGYTLAEGVELPFITVKVGEANPNVKANIQSEENWIALARRYTDIYKTTIGGSWNEYLTERFYAKVPFGASVAEGDGLNWQKPSASAVPWDGAASTQPNTGDVTTQKNNAMANPAMEPPLDGYTYYVYSPSQLLFALQAVAASTEGTAAYTIEIMDDFDMKGTSGYVWPEGISITGIAELNIHGNHHTVYNLYMLRGNINTTTDRATQGNTGLISEITVEFNAENWTFDGANVLGNATTKYATGVFCGYIGYLKETYAKLDDISVKNALVIGRGDNSGAVCGRMTTLNDEETFTYLQDCNATSVITIGGSHIGAMTGALTRFQYVNRCYTVDSTVISYGGHSGGLISCMTGYNSAVANCFVDAEVYGNAQTGVFTGSSNGGTGLAFANCFSSGFVEGSAQLGGFIGCTQNATTYFMDCYSTALVGMVSNAKYLGGFIGYTGEAISGSITGYRNCYAAGEVGSADTVVSGATAGQAHLNAAGALDYIGGFAGTTRVPFSSMVDCYYDKQTTAMREYDLGDTSCLNKTVFDSTVGDSVTGGNLGWNTLLGGNAGDKGLNGVLTIDTHKAGNGLTNKQPSSAVTGFTGFGDDSLAYDCATYKTGNASGQNWGQLATLTSYGWDYSEEGHYPELQVFSNNNAVFNHEDAPVAAAYSKSSTSTVMLETWDKGLDVSNGDLVAEKALSATAYDTVRDITLRFDMTGDAGKYKWYRTAKQDKQVADGDSANNNGAKVKLVYGSDKKTDVMVLDTSKNRYFADHFAPGLEWLQVKVDGASRRLRVMPTVGIEAGMGATLYKPSEGASDEVKKKAYYDHADDVELYFSTAERMAQNINDITTGIYPEIDGTGTYTSDFLSRTDNPLTENQKALMTGSSAAEISAYFGENGNRTNNFFGVAAGAPGEYTYSGVDLSYMSRKQYADIRGTDTLPNNNANQSKLYVYAKIIKSINSAGDITYSDKIMDLTDKPVADALNGLAHMPGSDINYVLLQYVWQLSDGRSVNDGKILTIRATPFSSLISIWDAGGLEDNANLALNQAALDTDKGLKDTDDALVNVQKHTGILADEDIESQLEDMTANGKSTSEYLQPAYKDTEGKPLPEDQVGPEYEDVLIASWQVENPYKKVRKLTLKLDSGCVDAEGKAIYFTVTADDIYDGKIITIPYEYYRYVISENGTLSVQVEMLPREYTIRYNAAKKIWYVALNHNETKTTNLGYSVRESDVVNNAEVLLEMSAELAFHKTVSGNLGDMTKEFEFVLNVNDQIQESRTYTYVIEDADGTTHTDASYTITDQTNGTIKLKGGQTAHVVGLPYGSTYTLEETEASSMGYTTKTDGVSGRSIAPGASLTVDTLTDPVNAAGIFTADRQHGFVNSREMAPPTDVELDEIPYVMIVLGILLLAGIGLGWSRYGKRQKKDTTY